MGTIYVDSYASHGQPNVLTKGEKKNIKCEVSQWSDPNHGQCNKYLVSKILNMNSTSRIPFSFVWFDDEIWSSWGGGGGGGMQNVMMLKKLKQISQIH
jgi:hypothetical protein